MADLWISGDRLDKEYSVVREAEDKIEEDDDGGDDDDDDEDDAEGSDEESVGSAQQMDQGPSQPTKRKFPLPSPLNVPHPHQNPEKPHK